MAVSSAAHAVYSQARSVNGAPLTVQLRDAVTLSTRKGTARRMDVVIDLILWGIRLGIDNYRYCSGYLSITFSTREKCPQNGWACVLNKYTTQFPISTASGEE